MTGPHYSGHVLSEREKEIRCRMAFKEKYNAAVNLPFQEDHRLLQPRGDAREELFPLRLRRPWNGWKGLFVCVFRCRIVNQYILVRHCYTLTLVSSAPPGETLRIILEKKKRKKRLSEALLTKFSVLFLIKATNIIFHTTKSVNSSAHN